MKTVLSQACRDRLEELLTDLRFDQSQNLCYDNDCYCSKSHTSVEAEIENLQGRMVELVEIMLNGKTKRDIELEEWEKEAKMEKEFALI